MKLFFIRALALFVAVVALAAFSVAGAIAETVSQHSQQHAAENAARNALKANGCAWTKTALVKNYRLAKDPKGMRVWGNELLITCTEWTAKPAARAVSWMPPTARADGSALPENQIAGYQIFVNGEQVGMTSATVYLVDFGAPGQHKVQLKTVDNDGLQSALSDAVEVDI